MTALSPEQARTLQRLEEAWKGRPFILVGATAIGCWMNMRCRQTADIDLAVACDLDEFPLSLWPGCQAQGDVPRDATA